MIRKAELADMLAILPMIERFNDKYFDVPINRVKTIDMVAWSIEDGVCFIADDGFIGGVLVEDLVRDWTVLQECGWYAEGRSGIKLLDAFIAAGRKLKVNDIRICTLATSSPSAGRLLQRKGFAPLETSHRLLTGATTCPQSLHSSPSQE